MLWGARTSVPPTVLDDNVAALDPTEFAQPLHKGGSPILLTESEPDPAPRKPMIGSLLTCCARAAIGHAAAPPSSVMKSRRFMCGWPPPGKR